MSEVDLKEEFDRLFGKDERTDAEREQEKLKYDCSRNDSAQASFERSRDRRLDKLRMDARIREIAQEYSYYVLKMIGFFAALYYVGNNFGALASFGLVAAAWAYIWNDDRKHKQSPQYMLGQVDELAEETVIHERIAALASEGKPWLTDSHYGSDNEGALAYPYWHEVNKKVSVYASQSHKLRIADNNAAKAASLQYRRKALSDVRAKAGDAGLPYWAEVSAKERKS